MSLIDPRTARVLITVLLFVLVLGFLYIAHYTLVAFLFAVFFAYLVESAVFRIEKWTKSRGWAIAAIYLVTAGIAGDLFLLRRTEIARQTQRLTESLPKLLDNVSSGNIAVQIGQERGCGQGNHHAGAEISVQPSRHAVEHRPNGRHPGGAGRAAIVAAGGGSGPGGFFLKDGRGFTEVGLSFLHAKAQREFLQGVLDDSTRCWPSSSAHN